MHIGLFMYRFEHRLLLETFAGYFQWNSEVHQHFTRTTVVIGYIRTLHRTKNRQTFSISCCGLNVWNLLPTHLTDVANSNYVYKS